MWSCRPVRAGATNTNQPQQVWKSVFPLLNIWCLLNSDYTTLSDCPTSSGRLKRSDASSRLVSVVCPSDLFIPLLPPHSLQRLTTCPSSPLWPRPWVRPPSALPSWHGLAVAPAPSPQWTITCTSLVYARAHTHTLRTCPERSPSTCSHILAEETLLRTITSRRKSTTSPASCSAFTSRHKRHWGPGVTSGQIFRAPTRTKFKPHTLDLVPS